VEGPAIHQPELRRSLRFLDLVLFGIILIQPTAPMPSFGIIYQRAHGHVVTCILLALVGMLLTAVSYGRMARVHPQGGSAFMYVGKELHPALGYLAGWCMAMDYILNPLICTIWCAKAAENVIAGVPYIFWATGFAVLFTLLNLNGVETSARVNKTMAAVLGAIIVLFAGAALRYLLLHTHAAHYYTLPFYNPQTYSTRAVLGGTSIAVLTYIGFDGISTLSDEARDPSRTVPRAIVATCLITGVLASIEVYLGQLIWPLQKAFPDVDTAFVQISGIAGGHWLFLLVNTALLLATIGSGMASQLGAARLLLAMGQDGALPTRFFGAIEPKRRIPRNNILLIGGICLLGALAMSYELGTELLNYGALLAFMGVNLASARYGWRVRGEGGQWVPIVLALLGCAVCFGLWISLSEIARITGTVWAVLGVLLYLARRSRTRRGLAAIPG
jgi:amino acid transporter